MYVRDPAARPLVGRAWERLSRHLKDEQKAAASATAVQNSPARGGASFSGAEGSRRVSRGSFGAAGGGGRFGLPSSAPGQAPVAGPRRTLSTDGGGHCASRGKLELPEADLSPIVE